MPVIHLVRHGQASSGAETAQEYDVLSDTGRRQAEIVGAELARRGLRDPLVACGTLARQRDTAEILMKAAGLTGTPRTDARWNEYDHFGLVERYGIEDSPGGGAAAGGRSLDNRGFQTRLDRALLAWMQDTDDGGWERFATGASDALRELAAALAPGRDAVVVTSGGVLAALCGGLLSAPAAGVVALNRVVINAAITTVLVGASGITLLSFNDHAHFTGDRRHLLTYR